MSGIEATGETFSTYFGKVLVGRHGFADAVPPGAEGIAAACDRVLFRRLLDGRLLVVACIVDRDTRPDAIFGLSPSEILAFAQGWIDRQARCGTAKTSVVVQIYEIGAGALTRDSERRLAAYRAGKIFGRGVRVVGALADPDRRLVWTGATSAFGRPTGAPVLRALIAKPRVSEADLAPSIIASDLDRTPWITAGLLAALTAIFVAETLFPIEPWTGALHATIRTLLAFGGVDRTLVIGEGQWWRMAIAPLLHGDAFHLAFNGLALWLIGRLSERLMGRAWFAATFAVSALAGSALSILANPANMLSVGASGAIVGLFVATYTLSYHLPSGDVRTRLQSRTLGTLVPALIPIFSTVSGGKIDYGAHFGGALGGLVMGLVMSALWPNSLPRPRFARVAGVIAVLGLLLAVAAVRPGSVGYRRAPLYAEFFQPWPTTEAQARADAYEIVTTKPRDSRGHFVEGLSLIDAKDLPGAEIELRKALSDPDMLALLVSSYEDRIRLALGAVLLEEKKTDEARLVLAPACAAEKLGSPLSADIARLKLCP